MAYTSEEWDDKDVLTAQSLYRQGVSFPAIARHLNEVSNTPRTRSGVRYILIKRGVAPKNGIKITKKAISSGVEKRSCVRCGESFQPLTRYLFTCDPCKESPAYKEETSTPW
jgi:hypothetical protein